MRGATCSARDRCHKYFIFQPTRPLRGATSAPSTQAASISFQPTRPLRGATYAIPGLRDIRTFQPTRPLRGATETCAYTARYIIFQPTRPLRGATYYFFVPNRLVYFNPRAPCGARPLHKRDYDSKSGFQPTRPLRGATSRAGRTVFHGGISTHAPLAGRDCRPNLLSPAHSDFNPRAPCGARQEPLQCHRSLQNFNPRAPCGARQTCLRTNP